MAKASTLLENRALVSGGSGFLGSHLCDRLIERGQDVLCVDNLFTGQKRNVFAPPGRTRSFEFMRHDVTFPLFVEVTRSRTSPARPRPSTTSTIRCRRPRPASTAPSTCWASPSACGAKILQASTSEVYGDPQVHPQTEDYWGNVNPIGPRSCYDEGKRCAETLFFDYHRQNQLKIKVIRIFNTYGPRMHPNDGRVVSNFIMQALRGENITIYGEGTQTRSFCYVDDLIDGHDPR